MAGSDPLGSLNLRSIVPSFGHKGELRLSSSPTLSPSLNPVNNHLFRLFSFLFYLSLPCFDNQVSPLMSSQIIFSRCSFVTLTVTNVKHLSDSTLHKRSLTAPPSSPPLQLSCCLQRRANDSVCCRETQWQDNINVLDHPTAMRNKKIVIMPQTSAHTHSQQY